MSEPQPRGSLFALAQRRQEQSLAAAMREGIEAGQCAANGDDWGFKMRQAGVQESMAEYAMWSRVAAETKTDPAEGF